LEDFLVKERQMSVVRRELAVAFYAAIYACLPEEKGENPEGCPGVMASNQ